MTFRNLFLCTSCSLTTIILPLQSFLATWNQQRARLKAVDLLRDSERQNNRGRHNSKNSTAAATPTVVIATDVAARGLDIPNVSTVIHYDAARTVDGFVHRAGRTAVRYYLFSFLPVIRYIDMCYWQRWCRL